MDHIGIDVHKRESQIYMLAEGGEVVEQRIVRAAIIPWRNISRQELQLVEADGGNLHAVPREPVVLVGEVGEANPTRPSPSTSTSRPLRGRKSTLAGGTGPPAAPLGSRPIVGLPKA
jgi:hypothetical protein